jgi:hypothetical protein
MNSVLTRRNLSGAARVFARGAGSLCLMFLWRAVSFPTCLAADLPLTRFDSVAPAAAHIGAEVEVQAAGVDLEGVDAAWFSHPGLSAKLVKEKVFGVKVEAGVPEGVYDMRLVGNNGVSNPRAIYVGRNPAVPKAGECSREKPMDLPPNGAVHGATVAGGRDHFRFQARKGQRLTVRCLARELDSRLTPVFTLSDAEGRRLRSNERRSFIDFVPPQDGAYTVSVQDLAFAGGPEYFYRLTVDESPVLEAVLPSAVEPGKSNRLVLLGRGLKGGKPSARKGADGRPLEELEVQVEIPSGTGSGAVDGPVATAAGGLRTFSYRYRAESGVSNPVELALVEFPVVAVQSAAAAPGGDAAPVAAVGFPGVASGLFEKGLEGVPLEFEAKKGDVLVAEVFSHRLGFGPTNSYLRLAKDGNHLAEAYGPDVNTGGPRFSTLHNDPTLRFEVKEDGKYTLRVSDLSGVSRLGPGAAYSLVLRKAKPGFALLAATEPPIEKADDRQIMPRGAVLRAGGTAALRVIALRSDGFDKEILLSAEGLPAGVSCETTRILAGKNEGYLILRTEPGAARNLAQVRVTGRSEDGALQSVARGATARWLVPDYNTAAGEMRLTRGEGIVVATTNASAPLVLSPAAKAPLEVEAGAKLEVALQVNRSPDFKEPLKIKSAGFPGAETVKEVEADPKAEQVKVPLDLAALKLPPGSHTAYFTAQSKAKVSGRDVITTAFSFPVQIVVRAPAPKPPAAPTPAPAKDTPPAGAPPPAAK